MKIESGLSATDLNARISWPFRNMKIGDSFFCEHPSMKVSVRAWNHGNKHRKKFIVKTVTEKGIRGTRCWRIE